jgi:hypothetical protein
MALGDGNEMVREGAAQTMGKIGDPKAVNPLVIAPGQPAGHCADCRGHGVKNVNE